MKLSTRLRHLCFCISSCVFFSSSSSYGGNIGSRSGSRSKINSNSPRQPVSQPVSQPDLESNQKLIDGWALKHGDEFKRIDPCIACKIETIQIEGFLKDGSIVTATADPITPFVLVSDWAKVDRSNSLLETAVYDESGRPGIVLGFYADGEYLLAAVVSERQLVWRAQKVTQLLTAMPQIASALSIADLSTTTIAGCADIKLCAEHNCAKNLLECGHYTCTKCFERGSPVACISCLADKVSEKL